MNKVNFNCGPFDLDGLNTDNDIYPLPWKFAKFFIALGFVIMTLTIFLTLATFCRQSIVGKSIHTVTGSAQAVAGYLSFFPTYSIEFDLNLWNFMQSDRIIGCFFFFEFFSDLCIDCAVSASIRMGNFFKINFE